MLKLLDFVAHAQRSGCDLVENGQLIIGGNGGGEVNGNHTETGHDTTDCDYYATYDEGDTECWRLDSDCCDPA